MHNARAVTESDAIADTESDAIADAIAITIACRWFCGTNSGYRTCEPERLLEMRRNKWNNPGRFLW